MIRFRIRIPVCTFILGGLLSGQTFASPIAGTWQGPCENRTNQSVMFTYVISETNEAGVGEIDKTKIYYHGLDCESYNRTGRAKVEYLLGEPSTDSIYPLDVNQRGRWFYDIVHVSEDGKILSFADKFATERADRPSVLSTSTRVFTLVE